VPAAVLCQRRGSCAERTDELQPAFLGLVFQEREGLCREIKSGFFGL